VDPENVQGIIERAGWRGARRFGSLRELIAIMRKVPVSRSAERLQERIRRS
jgi:hypothetical protein